MINTIFLPLTLQTTILSFLQYVSGIDWISLPEAIATNLVNNNQFFLRYMIQLTFVSNGVQLLDIPHYFVRQIKKFFHY